MELTQKGAQAGLADVDSGSRSSVGKVLVRMLPYVRPYVWTLGLAGTATVLTALLSLAVPAITRGVLDRLIVQGDTSNVVVAALLIIGVGLAEGVASFASRYSMESVGFKVVYSLRRDLYQHLHELSFEFHDNARIGDVMSRVTSDTDLLSRMFGFAIPYIAANSLTLIGIAAVTLWWNWRMGLAFLFLVPLMIRAMLGYAFHVQPAFARSQQVLGRLSETLRIILSGVRVTKLFAQEARELGRFEEVNREYVKVNMSVARVSAYWMPHVSFLIGVATAVTLGVVGIEVISGRASPGTLVAFVAYMGMLMRPIRQTGMLTASLVRGAAAGGRILDVINRESRVKQAANAYELPPLQGEISFENVEFSYQEGAAALEEIDFSVKPGELVAIVGPTGAGKTTLVHLIPRFYDPSAGRVLLDGHDVREVTLSSLRMQVGTVLQNVFLFSGTVKENIAFGRPEASFAEVRRAAELAQIHDEIQQLPQGYDTMLGERGAGLSGGQRQRLALARVLLTNPRVLILDEMSSELDAVTEKKLRDALEHAFRGRTTLVIAHRLWTIQRADRIVVLDAGKVVESGTHAELVVRGGLYKDIYAALVGKRKSGSAGPDYDRQDAQHDGRVAIAGGERR